MVRNPQGGSHDETPQSFPETTPPRSDMPAYSAQVLFEMNHTLGRMEGTLSALCKQVEVMDGRIQTVEKHWNWITGAVAVAVFLIPACAYAIWWALSDKIEAILRLIQSSPA